jgi:hypothetical protein
MCSLITSWLIIVFNEHVFHLFQWSSDNLSLGRSSFSTAAKVEAISLCQDADLLVSWHSKWQEAHQIVVPSQVAASLSWLSCQSVMMITTCIYIHTYIYTYNIKYIYIYIYMCVCIWSLIFPDSAFGQCWPPPMTGSGSHIPRIGMVMTGGWFMALLYPLVN